jgi:hypothetical protein
MNPFALVLLILIGAGIAGVCVFLARLLSYRHAPSADIAEEFSAQRYEPMAHLMADDDLQFLAAQAGVDAQDIDEFKRERRQIFRMYLRELAADFERLHRRARELASVAPEQHSELVTMLMGQQVAFWRLLAGIEIRLVLAPLRLGPADPRKLVDLVGSLGAAVTKAGGAPGPITV